MARMNEDSVKLIGRFPNLPAGQIITICVQCKHHQVEIWHNDATGWDHHYDNCHAPGVVKPLNFVTGEIEVRGEQRCKEINTDGNCMFYEIAPLPKPETTEIPLK